MKQFGILIAAAILAALTAIPPAHATDPHATCEFRARLVSRLTGKPHFERQALVLQDEMPGQGHRFELFVSANKTGRHSYTLLRTLKGTKETCIVTAGLLDAHPDKAHHGEVILLDDENDPVDYTLVICEKVYVISRSAVDGSLCENVHEIFGTSDKAAGYGRLLEDHRDDVPLLGQKH